MTDARQVVEAFEDTIQTRWRTGAGIDAVLAYLDPDVEVIEAPSLPYSGVFEGHDGFRELSSRMAELWEFAPGKTFDYIDDGTGRVMVLTLGRAIAKETGREVEWRLAELFTVRDGLIVEIRPFYWDTAAIVAATRT
jgi:ketosteroid isomerase-like protein